MIKPAIAATRPPARTAIKRDGRGADFVIDFKRV